MPAGVVAQIQGHKPSALAEKHYRRRPLDLLRQWHSRIEAWMLEQAGIDFKPDVSLGATFKAARTTQDDDTGPGCHKELFN